MSILESLKETKKLSFSHWRYRLLHWTFNVENPQQGYTGLPKYLYTHYCPLFHLTNLIAILSPLILSIKISVAVTKVLWGAAVASVGGIEKLFSYIPSWPKSKPTATVKEEVKELTLAQEINKWYLLVLDNPHCSIHYLWPTFKYKFNLLQEQQAAELHSKWALKIQQDEETRKIRDQKRKERWLFWINFSSVFVKYGINVAYVLFTILAIWTLFYITMPVINCIISCVVWIFDLLISINLSHVFDFVWRFGVIASLIALIMFIIIKLPENKATAKLGMLIVNAIIKVSPQLSLVWTVISAPFIWIYNGCVSTKEFITMFYEENCPPVEIVTEENEQNKQEVS